MVFIGQTGLEHVGAHINGNNSLPKSKDTN